MKIRRFKNGDENSLFSVFLSSVHTLASHYYTHEQIDAWAPSDIDPDHWTNRMRALRPFVVEVGSELDMRMFSPMGTLTISMSREPIRDRE